MDNKQQLLDIGIIMFLYFQKCIDLNIYSETQEEKLKIIEQIIKDGKPKILKLNNEIIKLS